MSGESLPITLATFAEAIKELPLAAVYSKVSELRNSISHLKRSNAELSLFATDSCDTESERREVETYISENEDVIISMGDRIIVLKAEVEGRGQLWIEEGENQSTGIQDDGSQLVETSSLSAVTGTAAQNGHAGPSNAPATASANRPRDAEVGQIEGGVHL